MYPWIVERKVGKNKFGYDEWERWAGPFNDEEFAKESVVILNKLAIIKGEPSEYRACQIVPEDSPLGKELRTDGGIR